ncbi:hypothetical protein KAFR_0A08550 [Kazachstania africana CBS 2517]|uniref:Uncharacterized protein n=1 Tax=Kazachstania africana (strain ATCC 22294 / BCRC 22015 / CBS 2517 / CECT 1963 / NBRC 1671 / NRRL Y-8276) TaxID=1071382 RepID=H2API9_KAZAF|nr:hypothetical protein KAFR_0A08550 [Kazachstania africana CBS 2517]CCF56289.1 hypothetical protein KAFR_0A08550 [Kazachstania africana CBS 2517]
MNLVDFQLLYEIHYTLGITVVTYRLTMRIIPKIISLCLLFTQLVQSATTASTDETTSTIDRPDPSTKVRSVVTSISVDSYFTVTEGTTKTYTSLRDPTSIYVTITTEGVTLVVQTTYGQAFSSQYTAVATPSSGSIGLGTIEGTVGVVKPAMYYTVTNNDATHAFNSNLAGVIGSMIAFITFLI